MERLGSRIYIYLVKRLLSRTTCPSANISLRSTILGSNNPAVQMSPCDRRAPPLSIQPKWRRDSHAVAIYLLNVLFAVGRIKFPTLFIEGRATVNTSQVADQIGAIPNPLSVIKSMRSCPTAMTSFLRQVYTSSHGLIHDFID